MDLGKTVSSSLKWVAAAKTIGQIITWTITIYVIRILEPEDYGILALAMAVMGLISLINEMGFGSVIVQKTDLAKETIRKIFGLLIVVNSACYVLLYLLSPLAASFFNEPILSPVLQVVGLELLITTLIVVPQGLLTREMKFQYIASIDFIRTLSTSISTLIFALQGYGVWSLIYGNLIGVSIKTVLLYLAEKDFYKPKFSFTGMKEIVGFGGLVTSERILWFLYSELDVFIIGKFLGKEILGVYSVAKQLAYIPMVKVTQLLSDISFAAFSKIQNDLKEVSYQFLKTARLISIFSFPIFFGMSSVANEIVYLLLGEKWKLAIMPLHLLCLTLPLRMLQSILPTALLGLGKPVLNVKNEFTACVMLSIGLFIGLEWGLLGVCLAWVIVYPIYFLIILRWSLPVLGVKYFDYLREIKNGFLSAVLMYLMVYLTRELILVYSLPTIIQLGILVIIGAVTYAIAIISLQQGIVQEVKKIVM